MINYAREMEQSLIDFKEKKKSCTGPKAKQKFKVKKVKPIKGQKDIKTLFEKNNSDLVTFTKDFNKVCVKSGIDVDSEQLQLAIALSKSLQQPDQIEAKSIQTDKLESSQDRSNRIRRTLQEYGFKVSSTYIKPATNRRGKSHRKSYKLLLVTEEEKLQKINDRYTQILLENPCKFIEKDKPSSKIIENGLYYLSTNISYECMKRNETFYVSEILCEISNAKGNMLKNWADIPGRPSSPVEIKDKIVSISDLECTQVELDIMLSGTLKEAKGIYNKKIIHNPLIIQKDGNVQNTSNIELNIESSSHSSESIFPTINKSTLTYRTGNNETNVSNCSKLLFLCELQRSQSPDIFDEEDTATIEDSVKNKCVPEKLLINNPTFDSKKFEDCEFNQCTSQLSQNITKRRTNDFMDLTECVPVNSQILEDKLKLNFKTANKLQLIQDNMEVTKCINHISPQSSPSACNLIDLTQQVDNSLEVNTKEPESVKENFSTLDITQSSNSDDDLPAVGICGTQKITSEDTAVVNYDGYFDIEPTQKTFNCFVNKQSTSPIFIKEVLKDNFCEIKKNSIEVQEQGIKGHSSFSSNSIINNITAKNCNTTSVVYKNDDNSYVDLTQPSGSRFEMCVQNSCKENANDTTTIEYNYLGKKNNVSIDYDDIHQDGTVNMYSLDEKFDSILSKNGNISKTVHTGKESNKNDVINCSNTSECVYLSDDELNYSISNTRTDIIELDNILSTETFCNMNNSKDMYNLNDNGHADRSYSGSYVPTVKVNYNMKTNDMQQQTETHITLCESTCSTPMGAIRDNQISIQTPTNSEYVVKTGNVTPMLDYGGMSSPEINYELEKYGLKPFKRKRAIQLLTHLYNQTHPVIEYCSEEPVAAKKSKPDSQYRPYAIIENVDKDTNIQVIGEDKENMYRQTKDVPDIRDIECSDEDWVFQNREKKVHTCRVPLHIALHNYISCRRALREAILRYEPINIDVIHKDLISYGYKYNPKDLQKFLDKHCITVKTAEDNRRNNKR